MDDEVEKFRRDTYERWRDGRTERRALAIEILDGRKKVRKTWPEWMRRDVLAEIAVIQAEREESIKSAEALAKKRREVKTDKEHLM